MDLATKMNVQTRDHLNMLRGNLDPCPGRRSYATKEDAERHRLRGMRTALCQKCYRFHSGPAVSGEGAGSMMRKLFS